MNTNMTTAVVDSVIVYEAMCTAIATCESKATCLDIIDKSAALKEYARRVKNTDAEIRAANVRLIAERRLGDLLKELARATPQERAIAGGHAKAGNLLYAPSAQSSPYSQALEETGISRRTAERYQALASVPKEIFDAAIKDPASPPSLKKVVTEARDTPVPQIPEDSLWLWGRMRDFERGDYASKDVETLLAAMTETMRKDVARLAGPMADFFNALMEVQHESA